MIDRLRQLVIRSLPTGGVVEQTVKSGAWLGAMNVMSRGLQIILLIVLANLLSPADFGLMGITLLVLSALQKFSLLGLDAAVIQQYEDNVDKYMNTMWVLEIARGLLIASVMYLAAPAIGSLFSEPRAVDLLRIAALAPILTSLKNPGIVYFKKQLNFHLEFTYRMSGSLVWFVVTLGWALVSPTVWALVAGHVASRFTKLIVSYLVHDYRPWPSFDMDRARELISYGKWVTGNSILYFLYSEGDDVVVGWLLSATALGFYQTAYRISNAPATEITQIISTVTFPAFSTLQKDVGALREAYYRTLQMTMFISFPAALGIAAVADVFVRTFMGADWIPMIRVMQILAVYGLVRSMNKTMGPVWKAIGRPDYVTKLSALRVIIIAILIIPLTNAYGIEGTALLIVGVTFFPSLPLNTYIIINSIEGNYSRFFREISYPLVASLGMFGAVVALDLWLPFDAGVLEFLILVATGAIVYVGLVALLVTQFEWAIEDNLRSLVRSLA